MIIDHNNINKLHIINRTLLSKDHNGGIIVVGRFSKLKNIEKCHKLVFIPELSNKLRNILTREKIIFYNKNILNKKNIFDTTKFSSFWLKISKNCFC